MMHATKSKSLNRWCLDWLLMLLLVVAVAIPCLAIVAECELQSNSDSIAQGITITGRQVAIVLANALLLLSPFWLLGRKWKWLVILPIILLTVWSVMQLCYLREYSDLMPLQSLTMTGNVNSTLLQNAIALMKPIDGLIIVSTLLFLIGAMVMLKRVLSHYNRIYFKYAVINFLITITLCALFACLGYWRTGGDSLRYRLSHNFSNRTYYIDNGLLPYWIQSVSWWLRNEGPTPTQREIVNQFLAEQCPHYSDNRYADTIRAPRNLVVIVVESLHTWPIGMTLSGHEVTPNLNRLVHQSGVIYAPHMLFQTSHGRSSDAYFIYNTGLLPLRDEAVAVNYAHGPYPSLAKALKGYDCRAIICTPSANWNQNITAHTYGFETLYTRDHLQQSGLLTKHCGVEDAALSDYAGHLLPHLREPFFLEMVTMTMHAPYYEGKVRDSWITASDTLTSEARVYLNCVNVMDSCVGAFLDGLAASEIGTRTVVAILSDHTEFYLANAEGRRYEMRDWSIPAIIAGTDTTMCYEPVIGQIDIYPTLLDVMGANQYRWKGLGHSILRYPITSAHRYSNEAISGVANAYSNQQMRAWQISEWLIKDASRHRLP